MGLETSGMSTPVSSGGVCSTTTGGVIPPPGDDLLWLLASTCIIYDWYTSRHLACFWLNTVSQPVHIQELPFFLYHLLSQLHNW